MSEQDDPGKAAVAGRAALEAALRDVATVLEQTATALALSCVRLQEATERERVATETYIVCLEKELHRRASLN